MLKRVVIVFLNNFIRKSSLVTRMLFGVKVLGSKRIHWDFTTLALKKAINRHIEDGMRVLEMGTGPHAILSVYMAKKYRCEIVACDINPEYVRSAIETAKLNDVSIEVVESDYFANITGEFDVIIWNAVYIPYKVGIKSGIDNLCDYETDWCGGETGLESIEKFLQTAPDCLKVSGDILLGFNNFYLKENLVLQRCKDLGFLVIRISKGVFNPSRVVTIRKSNPPSA